MRIKTMPEAIIVTEREKGKWLLKKATTAILRSIIINPIRNQQIGLQNSCFSLWNQVHWPWAWVAGIMTSLICRMRGGKNCCLLFSHEVMSDSFATPWMIACQSPVSLGFFRQECWNGLPFPSPGDLPDPGIEPVPPALAGRFFTTEPSAKPKVKIKVKKIKRLISNLSPQLAWQYFWIKFLIIFTELPSVLMV